MDNKIQKFRDLVKMCFDIPEYLSRFIELTDEAFYHCPICDSGARELVIDVENQRFACCNCENHGDFITLLEHIKHEPLMEVLVAIVRNVNVSVVETDKISRKKKRHYKNNNVFHY